MIELIIPQIIPVNIIPLFIQQFSGRHEEKYKTSSRSSHFWKGEKETLDVYYHKHFIKLYMEYHSYSMTQQMSMLIFLCHQESNVFKIINEKVGLFQIYHTKTYFRMCFSTQNCHYFKFFILQKFLINKRIILFVPCNYNSLWHIVKFNYLMNE